MTDSGPGIALLFDDGELGNQLRLALQEHGARIVHEGSVASLSRDVLTEHGVDVVVVNLDDEDAAALDQLYDVVDGNSPRVVFNDGQASRALGGWDRARWARHLAAKVMASADVDPPRPPAAVSLGVPVADMTVVTAESGEAVDIAVPMNADATTTVSAPPAAVATDDDAGPGYSAATEPSRDAPGSADSDSLEAELEAMLASDALSTGDDEFGPGLRYFEDAPELHDGEFGESITGEPGATDEPSGDDSASVDREAVEPAPASATDFVFDHLPSDLTIADEAAPIAEKAPAPVVVTAPDSWALLDDDAPVASAPAPDKTSAASFGVVKQSAAEFLSPEVENAAPSTEPVMSLQLLTMEEAVAPQPYTHEMQLDDNARHLHRIVLLGAAADGLDSVCDFLSVLPKNTRLTFLLTQHLGTRSMAEVMEVLSVCGPLTIRLATDGSQAAPGELLVVPGASQVSLRRDGTMALHGSEANAADEPSIDANFSTIANIFGSDVVAIVFAGRSTDAVAGAQAVHDLGGKVWAETSPDGRYSDMVGSIFAERLVSFSGTPHELAAHLIEVYS